jgi:hypothetical protein
MRMQMLIIIIKAKADITAEVENDQRQNVKKLTQAHGVTPKMGHDTLHKDQHLSKKSARLMTILL